MDFAHNKHPDLYFHQFSPFPDSLQEYWPKTTVLIQLNAKDEMVCVTDNFN